MALRPYLASFGGGASILALLDFLVAFVTINYPLGLTSSVGDGQHNILLLFLVLMGVGEIWSVPLHCGVSQGLLFMKPLHEFEMINKYADDIQFYVFTPGHLNDAVEVLS